jgi:hypothetical protein
VVVTRHNLTSRARNGKWEICQLLEARLTQKCRPTIFPLLTIIWRIVIATAVSLADGCLKFLRRFTEDILKKVDGENVREMLLSSDFASESDLLDRMMEHGIVVEVWDRVELAGIDMTGMHVSVSSIRLFTEGRNPPFRAGYFWKVDPS